MGSCAQDSCVSAFLDGEMIADQRIAFERHLQGCSTCADTLQQFRSNAAEMMAQRPAPEPGDPIAFRRRLHDAIDREWNSGLQLAHERSNEELNNALRRMVWRCAGLAACLLVGGSAWLWYSGGASPAGAPAAQMLATDVAPVGLATDIGPVAVASDDWSWSDGLIDEGALVGDRP